MSAETIEETAPAEPGTVPEPRSNAALAVRSEAHTLPARIQYARELANSGLLPKDFRRNPANVLYAVEFGEMLGLKPMAAITGIHVIEGKPTASAGLISALVRRAGHKLRVRGDANSATCEIVRADDPDYTFAVTWTLKKNRDGNPSAEDAKLLHKEVWQKYAASMLKSRAITQCARDACEEALFGLHYTPEELGAEVDEDGHVYGGTVVDGPPAADPAEKWYTQPASQTAESPQWLETALARSGADDLTKDEIGKLWTEATRRNKAGVLPDDRSRELKTRLTGRLEQFKAAEPAGTEPAEADIVEGEIVDAPPTVYGLDPEDDWASKVQSIADEADADAALADVGQQVKSGSMAAEHAEAVALAIDARMAELASKAVA